MSTQVSPLFVRLAIVQKQTSAGIKGSFERSTPWAGAGLLKMVAFGEGQFTRSSPMHLNKTPTA
jgi:hypothetical protein